MEQTEHPPAVDGSLAPESDSYDLFLPFSDLDLIPNSWSLDDGINADLPFAPLDHFGAPLYVQPDISQAEHFYGGSDPDFVGQLEARTKAKVLAEITPGETEPHYLQGTADLISGGIISTTHLDALIRAKVQETLMEHIKLGQTTATTQPQDQCRPLQCTITSRQPQDSNGYTVSPSSGHPDTTQFPTWEASKHHSPKSSPQISPRLPSLPDGLQSRSDEPIETPSDDFALCPPQVSIDFAPRSRQTSSDLHLAKPRRSRAQFSLESIEVLETWLKQHVDDPYPTKHQKETMAKQAGLTVKQVNNWFSNSRKRKLSSVEQWLSSSEEDEDVKEAVARHLSRSPQRRVSGFSSADMSYRSPASIYGGHSSASSVGSAFSQCSAAMLTRSPRRGRRKHSRTSAYVRSDYSVSDQLNDDFFAVSPLNSPHISPELRPRQNLPRIPSTSSLSLDQRPVEAKISFQCTFCYKHLSEKAWKRHEETQHLPKTKYVCMSTGPTILDNALEFHLLSQCAFCLDRPLPLDDHFSTQHRISECLEKPIDDRTFFRRDHLKQHVETYHGARFDARCAEHWRQDIDRSSQTWHCGFCGCDLGNDWDLRAMHIAEHFRKGLSMNQWIHEGPENRGVLISNNIVHPELLHLDSGPSRTLKHPATFQCTLCPKKFTRAYNLRSHLGTHTDERPFVCAVCGKAFARQHDQKRHEGLHSAEKMFICKGILRNGEGWGCHRRFARAHTLGRHFRSKFGQACIRPLFEEEGSLPGVDQLPAAILAQYPTLTGINWRQLDSLDSLADGSGYTSDSEFVSEARASTVATKGADADQQPTVSPEILASQLGIDSVQATNIPSFSSSEENLEMASGNATIKITEDLVAPTLAQEGTWIWEPEYQKWYLVTVDNDGNAICLGSQGAYEGQALISAEVREATGIEHEILTNLTRNPPDR